MAHILSVGECLWDSLPSGLFLGGAPLNVAVHVAEQGYPAKLASRIGKDVLGSEVRTRLEKRNVGIEALQSDDELPTGFVKVFTDSADVSYEIMKPSAWDAIQSTSDLLTLASDAEAVVYGTLAQREKTSRETVQAIKAEAKKSVFDLNLRPPYDEKDMIDKIGKCAEEAFLVKMNYEELQIVSGWMLTTPPSKIEDRIATVASKLQVERLCVTFGADGSKLFDATAAHEKQMVSAKPVLLRCHEIERGDAVGAGDAFLARLITALLFEKRSTEEALQEAAIIGAYVATCRGALPEYKSTEIEAIRNQSQASIDASSSR